MKTLEKPFTGAEAKRLHFSLGHGRFREAALSLSDAAEPSTNVHLQLYEGPRGRRRMEPSLS
jgi:hypothetical protein